MTIYKAFWCYISLSRFVAVNWLYCQDDSYFSSFAWVICRSQALRNTSCSCSQLPSLPSLVNDSPCSFCTVVLISPSIKPDQTKGTFNRRVSLIVRLLTLVLNFPSQVLPRVFAAYNWFLWVSFSTVIASVHILFFFLNYNANSPVRTSNITKYR